MTSEEREAREFAVREGIESAGDDFRALLALRTVAYHLKVMDLHAEIDRKIQEDIK